MYPVLSTLINQRNHSYFLSSCSSNQLFYGLIFSVFLITYNKNNLCVLAKNNTLLKLARMIQLSQLHLHFSDSILC